MSGCLILYGSQTGAGKSIAEGLHREAVERGIAATLAPLNDWKTVGFDGATHVVVVVSTTGDGDAPSNAEDFCRHLRKRTQPKALLAGKRFAILGLGDTNYDKFCNTAKTLHKRILELGGAEFAAMGLADEAMGLDGVVEPWSARLWPALTAELGSAPAPAPAVAAATAAAAVAVLPPVPQPDDAIPPISTARSRTRSGSAGSHGSGSLSAVGLLPPGVENGSGGPMGLLSRLVAHTSHVADERARRKSSMDAAIASGAFDLSAPEAAAGEAAAPAAPEPLLPLPAGICSFAELFPVEWRVAADALAALPSALRSQRDVPLELLPERIVKGLPRTPVCTWQVLTGAAAVEGPKLVPTETAAAAAAAAMVVAAPAAVATPMRAPPSPRRATSEPAAADDASAAARLTMHNPARVAISAARYLTAGGAASARRVVHMELDVRGSSLEGAWAPGDVVGLIAPNAEVPARALAARLQLAADEPLRLAAAAPAPSAAAGVAGASSPSSLVPPWLSAAHALPAAAAPAVELLRWCVDTSSPPKKALLRLLADSAVGMDKLCLLMLCGRDSRALLAPFVEAQRLTLLELLQLFPSAEPPLAALLAALPALAPRFYSIASSPVACPGTIAVAFTVVEYACGASAPPPAPDAVGATPLAPADGGAPAPIQRRGLATSYLEGLCAPLLGGGGHGGGPPPTVRAFLRASKHFHMPASSATPLIMIGPGTGVSPFVGFLQHRAARRAAEELSALAVCRGFWRRDVYISGLRDDSADAPAAVAAAPAILFFGNRHPDVDFLYREELLAALAAGALTRLHTAFSRAAPDGAKVYVQQRMREEGAALAALVVDAGAALFVCGDGMKMAKDVHAALVDILVLHRPQLFGSAAAAEAFLAQLAKCDRYCRDVWS